MDGVELEPLLFPFLCETSPPDQPHSGMYSHKSQHDWKRANTVLALHKMTTDLSLRPFMTHLVHTAHKNGKSQSDCQASTSFPWFRVYRYCIWQSGKYRGLWHWICEICSFEFCLRYLLLAVKLHTYYLDIFHCLWCYL